MVVPGLRLVEQGLDLLRSVAICALAELPLDTIRLDHLEDGVVAVRAVVNLIIDLTKSGRS
ncbi:MAG: hypothetical protein ACM3MA_02990 [Acidobacteriota bacterium]